MAEIDSCRLYREVSTTPVIRIEKAGSNRIFKGSSPNLEKINLNEEGKNVSDNAELCRILNNYLSEVISNLKIPSLINNSAVDSNAVSNPLSIAI